MRDRRNPRCTLQKSTPRYLPARPRVTVDQLSFESGDEALGHRVVVGIRYPAHRG